jgi:hypothetical protein
VDPMVAQLKELPGHALAARETLPYQDSRDALMIRTDGHRPNETENSA